MIVKLKPLAAKLKPLSPELEVGCKLETNDNGIYVVDPLTGIKMIGTGLRGESPDRPTLCDMTDFLVQRHYESLKSQKEQEYNSKSSDMGLELKGYCQ